MNGGRRSFLNPWKKGGFLAPAVRLDEFHLPADKISPETPPYPMPMALPFATTPPWDSCAGRFGFLNRTVPGTGTVPFWRSVPYAYTTPAR